MQSMISRTLVLLALSFVCAVPAALGQQVVLLDFDTGTDGAINYTQQMRDDIEALMEGHYADFDVSFTQTTPGSGSYSTIFFNSGGAGGLASKIDFRNQDPSDTAVVNIQGLSGVSTTAQIVSASAIVGSHEMGHLLGLRHGDSFGPPGSGLSTSGTPGVNGYTPSYPGPSNADEFNDHIMASPASVGSTINDILTPSWFGERAAIKLSNNEQGTVQGEGALSFDILAVPNTLGAGDNAGRDWDVATFVGASNIGAADEIDQFTFTGNTGDLFTFEVISNAIDERIANLLDPAITVLDPGASPVAYYTSTATNDDEFETADSILIDLVLPSDGTYTIQVRASSTAPGDTGGYELYGYRFAVVNEPPVANDDAYDATEDTVLNVPAPGVLTNDSDADGDPLTASQVASASNGTVALNGDGSFSYTPDLNFCGIDSFTYLANDGFDDSNVATVTLTVECVNDPPVAADDAYNAIEDTQLSVPAPGVLANDSDVDGDALSVFSNTDVSHGSLTLNDDGSFTYTPNLNYCGPDSFTYVATDDPPATPPPLNSDPATVDITVACVNDPPVVTGVSPSSQTSDYSDSIGTVSVTVEDVDDTATTLAESGEPPASAAGLTVALSGCAVVDTESPDEDGSVCTFTYNGQVLDPGDNVYGIVFTPSDPDGPGTVTGTHTLTITPEDATVTLDVNNDVAVHVAEEGGDSGPFTLYFSAVETLPDLAGTGSPAPGDLNTMVPYIELVPVGPGSPEVGVCGIVSPTNPADGYDQIAVFECDFDGVPVNTYEVLAWVDGLSDSTRYYTGLDDSVLTVFDPSLGFTTGGGWFYWPGTADPELEACGDGGYPGDKTSFGFTMKYNKKMTKVQGSLLLQRHTVDADCGDAGKYRVKSNALDGLSIGENSDDTGDYGWAIFSGKSVFSEPSVEAEGNHSFLVYVEDHGAQGGNQDPADEFWIEVLNKDGNVVLEVNGPDSDPAGEDGGDGDDELIENGNIIVPHETGKRGGGKPE